MIEFKTNQGDLGFSTWGATGYIMIGLGMVLLAIPTIKFIQWIKKS